MERLARFWDAFRSHPPGMSDEDVVGEGYCPEIGLRH